MEVKKYIAGNMQEAIAKIKDDLGSDAMIISSRKIRQGKGMFGMFGKEMLEVTASGIKKEISSAPGYDATETINAARRQKDFYAERNYENDRPYYNNSPEKEEKFPDLTGMVVDPLRLEIDEVKSTLDDIREFISSEKNAVDNIAHLRYEIYELKGLVNTYLNNGTALPFKNLHKNLASVYQQLMVNGLEEKFAKRLIEEARFKIPQQNFDNQHYVKLYMARMLMQLIRTSDFSEEKQAGRQIFSFVGPTGVGKTSVLAKTAGLIKQTKTNAEIGIISTDVSRTGSTEQLKDFSKSLRAKFRSAENAADFRKALQEMKDRHYVLVDTPGIAQREHGKISTVHEITEPAEGIRHLLVISASTKDSDITEQTKRFGVLKLDGVVFTKLDESTHYGNILNHLIRFKIPLYFLSAGQRVPEDLEVASKERVIDLMMNFTAFDEQPVV